MGLLDHEQTGFDGGHEAPSGRGGRWLLVLLGIAALSAAVYLALPMLQPAEQSEVAERVAPAPEPAPAPVAPPEPEPEAPPPEPAPGPEPEPEPALAPPPARAPVRLRVTSDVVGADVFIDRRFVGTTPFESTDVTPGPHRINVSAAGYEGQLAEVEIGDRRTEVAVRFREVRLDQSVTVVHKHRFGDCEGRLVATLEGIRYATDHDDAFTIGLADLEEFEVDYLEHNLRIKQRGGRTYNFTDTQETADALFVFHREVEEARERLARGDAS